MSFRHAHCKITESDGNRTDMAKVSSGDFRELIRGATLPSPPEVAVAIIELAKDEGACFEDYSEVLSRDPVLASRVIKLANSPMFGLARTVTDLADACSLLGLRTIRTLALGFSLTAALPSHGGAKSFSHDEFWERTVLFAVAAREFALRKDRTISDEAFLCGLLATIGQLAMAHLIPKQYERLLRRADGWPTADEESKALGFDHLDATEWLLEHWGIPEELWAGATGWASGGDPQQPLAEVLTAARAVVALRFGKTTKGQALDDLHGLAADLGLDSTRMDALLLFISDQAKRLPKAMEAGSSEGVDAYHLLAQAREQMLELSYRTAADLNRSERRSRALESRVTQMTEQLNRDSLTGLGNRAFYEAALSEAIERGTKEDEGEDGADGLGLLVIDVDSFKGFNDGFGHPAGDEVLRLVGQVLGGTCRAGDIAARIGGDEFAVIVPNATLESLAGLGERLRRFIADTPLQFGRNVEHITLSIGGALLVTPCSCGDKSRLIAEADRQLYLAKHAGRNLVSISAEALEG
ncbi:MAG: GGDEF domain-containing protein [bacterium]|nr:GGDEF domain-containing protein [bacterium]MCP5068434.1 GGDEF domain-containing protein [bacterium]